MRKLFLVILFLVFTYPLFADEIRVQIIFNENTPYGTYQDALWFSQDEYNNLKQTDIDKMKQERVLKWVEIVSTPQVEATKTEKENKIKEQIEAFTLRIQELQVEKDRLNK